MWELLLLFVTVFIAVEKEMGQCVIDNAGPSWRSF